MFNLTSKQLEEMKAIYTSKEILQQPKVWRELTQNLSDQIETLRNFIETIYFKHSNVRIIFTGAGTSAFIGDILVPELRKQNQEKVQIEAIPTTDIVSNPSEYLIKNAPTIMVSFARSGNSPESVAAVKLGKDIIDEFYQVVITCNKNGQLAQNTKDDIKSITVLTPEAAHDQGFAMTSSFTSMVLAAYLIFSTNVFNVNELEQSFSNAEQLFESINETIEDIVNFDFERIVYLGSGLLGQLSHEAALKMLELSAGQVVAIHESSLGFRHGPKSILNEKSVVVLFMSQNPYTRKYDLDILRELSEDDLSKIVVLTDKKEDEIEQLADWTIPVGDLANDLYLALLYVTFAQGLALKKSIQLGITPDNPSPDGRVNRVVQGVTIYER
ncbi:SIS domain-containing protein [Ornithinibacillus sp. L9]|uniref:SIS domain-containing protein n=1 Tax=Ornithinibacillus caprae TaxID=2678566 RepID=A0A6N8FDX5_9BACI|nr:SIS domain-containing protein [Ornithinibacillus caprae]MUK87615.1 SIS domain-containing protein [Ornithinibacillus caprae]